MEKNLLSKALPLLILAILTAIPIGVASTTSTFVLPVQTVVTTDASLTANEHTMLLPTNVIVAGYHADGTQFYYCDSPNVVTNIGKNYSINRLFAWQPVNGSTYIAWSNDNYTVAPAATWTCLNNTVAAEINAAGLQRANGTFILHPSEVGNATIYNAFSVSGTIGNITLIGLFWSPTPQLDNVMLAAAAISSVNVQSGDTLNGTWIFTQA